MRYLITIVILLTLATLFVTGRAGFLMDFETLEASLAAFRGSVWAFPIIIGLFCVGAFIGAPQYAMIFGAVTLLGPMQGGLGAWVATLASGSLTFYLGKILGQNSFRRLTGEKVQAVAEKIAQNGFMGSLLVRLVPTAPFIIVNSAFAIAGIQYYKFLAGMALGIIPKIAIVAAAAQGAEYATTGNLTLASIMLAVAVVVFYVLFRFVRHQRRDQNLTH